MAEEAKIGGDGDNMLESGFVRIVITVVVPRAEAESQKVTRREYGISRLRPLESITDLVAKMLLVASNLSISPTRRMFDHLSSIVSSIMEHQHQGTFFFYCVLVGSVYYYFGSSREYRKIEDVVSQVYSTISSQGWKRRKMLKVVGIQETVECSICLQDMAAGREAYQLPCSHSYHYACICKWLWDSDTCPLCRFKLIPRYSLNKN